MTHYRDDICKEVLVPYPMVASAKEVSCITAPIPQIIHFFSQIAAMAPNRVLLTGRSGFIAAHVLETLLSRGYTFHRN
jgi:hypothetical protein